MPLIYVFATVVLLWPLVCHLRSSVAGTESDPLLNAWALRWVQHTLITHPSRLYDGNAFAPNPLSLTFSELLLPQAVMAWPAWLIAHDTLLAYNLAVLITYPSCALALYTLCRAVGAARGAALITGLCYAFAPFRLDNVAHVQVLSMQWMPCAILAVIRFVQRPTWLRGAAVAGTMALVALSSVYYAVIFTSGLAVFLLVEAVCQRRTMISRTGLGLALALSLAIALVALVDVPYITMRDEQGISRTLDEAYGNSARATSYLTTVAGSVVSHLLPTSGIGASALFPGALLTGFALLGLRRLRSPWLPGLFCLGVFGCVLSFGPTWGAKDSGWPLPYRFLYQHVILFQGLRGPDRFASLTLLAMAVFAAVEITTVWNGIARRWPRIDGGATVATALIAILSLIDVAAQIHPIESVDRSAETLAPYRWLAGRSDMGSIAEFPVARYEQRTAFYSTFHWQPVLWGHSGFIPSATYQLRGRFVGNNDYPSPETMDLLADMGVRTLIVHRSAYAASELAAIESRLAQEPDRISFLAHVGESDLFAIEPSVLTDALTVRVGYGINPAGNVDRLTGQLSVTNRDTRSRMLYTLGQPRVTARLRDRTNGKVEWRDVTVLLPAIIAPGTTMIPFSVKLPSQPGEYEISLTTTRLPETLEQSPAYVRVVSLTALPHLMLNGSQVTSPPLFTPGEPVALWLTMRGGKSVPLGDTRARDDSTIETSLPRLPPDTTQVVAQGKWSGVELWVSPA